MLADSKIKKFNINKYTSFEGAILLDKFFNDTSKNSRLYHVGLKALLEDNTEDTIFRDDILISAEGMNPRLLLF